jgi:hypothetical protein
MNALCFVFVFVGSVSSTWLDVDVRIRRQRHASLVMFPLFFFVMRNIILVSVR